MNEEIQEAKTKALEIRQKWVAGEITMGETRERLREYIDLFNKKSEEIAAKYKQKPKRFRLGDFLKYGGW